MTSSSLSEVKEVPELVPQKRTYILSVVFDSPGVSEMEFRGGLARLSAGPLPEAELPGPRELPLLAEGWCQ